MLSTLRPIEFLGPVALGVDGVLGADELWQNAATIAASLPPPEPGSMVAFAFGHDRAAFAAALLGTWMAGHGAALPENATRECVLPVMNRPQVLAFLHDTGVGLGIDVPRLLLESGDAVAVPEALPEDPGRVVFEAHTAVHGGQIHITAWTAAELLAAVDAVIARMDLPSGGVVVHGLTPSFLPAVLAGLLSPLRVGGAFSLCVPRDVQELAALARSCSAGSVVCSPFDVRALITLPSGSLPRSLTLACTGAVPVAAAEALHVGHDIAVHRVLDGVLAPSPFDDCVDKLLAINGVEDAAVASLPGSNAALIGIVGEGNLLLSARAAAASVLAEDIELFVQPVLELPRDSNGRIPHGELCTFFGRGRDGQEVTSELEWSEPEAGEQGALRFTTRIPEHFAYFEGHFTTYPVLAGAVQLNQLVLPCVRVAMPQLGMLQRLEAVKFAARIAPQDEIEVTISALSEGNRVQFEISCGGRRCTTGRLFFAMVDQAEATDE